MLGTTLVMEEADEEEENMALTSEEFERARTACETVLNFDTMVKNNEDAAEEEVVHEEADKPGDEA